MKKSTWIWIIVAIIVAALIIVGVVVSNKNSNNSSSVNEEEAKTTLEENTESENNAADLNENNETENDISNQEENTDDNTKSNSKILVAYYSATNNTKKVAEEIANELNADIFVIQPEEEYTSADLDWTDSNSRVNKEHEDKSLRDVKLKTTDVPNWDDFDTVFIGYPIWWGIAAWPTNSFVKAEDFTGKNVYTFCTSLSSGLGQSFKLLKDDSNSGNWIEGHRFSSSASDSDVKSWIDGLGL